MAAAKSDWENFPSYSELMHVIKEFVVYLYRESFVEESKPRPIESTWRGYNFTPFDLLCVVTLSIMWTFLRFFATEWIFKPMATRHALTAANQKKMPESAWKFMYCLCVWSYTLYVVVLSGKYKFFQRPSTVWDDWSLNLSPPFDIYLLYMVNLSFCMHSLYATLFLDTWRKDSLIMMFHHVLTLLLVSISYSLRCHNIGTLVFLTHDVCDILMEFSKLNVYFKIQGGKLVKMHELFANATFSCFCVAWIVSRLYCYPLRVLYTASYYIQHRQLELPCALLMNSLLWFLQILNIYWFLLIVRLLYQVATGQVQEVDDTREYDIEEKFKLSTKISFKEKDLLNGTEKTNGSCNDGAVSSGDVTKRDKKAN